MAQAVVDVASKAAAPKATATKKTASGGSQQITGMTIKDPTLNSYYQSILKTLPVETIDYKPIELETQTVDSISDQVSKYLRNYYDKSINSRREQTIANNAELDVDAASRGMTSSSWLTDAKNRQSRAEAADVAQLESDYNSQLAETVYNQYQNYLRNKLEVDTTNRANQIEVDEWNAQTRVALEQLAYQRALEELARNPGDTGAGGGGGGGGSSRGGGAGAWYFVKDPNTGRTTRKWLSKTDTGSRGSNLIREGRSVVVTGFRNSGGSSSSSSGAKPVVTNVVAKPGGGKMTGMVR